MSAPVPTASHFASRAWLAPLVPLYRLGLALRERGFASGRKPVWALERPVVSIGNLSTGGAGKTPLIIALAKALTARGVYVDVLSRGYGRKSSTPLRVQPAGTAEDFGDEPLLIARETSVPVYVAADRHEAGVMAESEAAPEKPAVHLLDDGFQHRRLYRDIDILLLHRRDWNDRLLPAGNLREEMSAALRADVIAIPGGDAEFETELRTWLNKHGLNKRGWQGPIWKLRRRMDVPRIESRMADPVVAFCGIAHPEQFFAGLEAAGLHLAERIVFRDHHRYTPRDLDRLRAAQQRAHAALITTAKDAIRLQPIAGDLSFQIADLRTEIEDEAEAVGWLINRLREGSNWPKIEPRV